MPRGAPSAVPSDPRRWVDAGQLDFWQGSARGECDNAPRPMHGSPMNALSPHHDAVLDLAIVGGGAAGLLTAVQALAAGLPAESIALFEPQPRLGRGVAYRTTCAEHLLNVPASRMSAFADDPDHFVRHLSSADGPDAGDPAQGPWGARFASRRDYADYLHSTLQAQPGAGGLRLIDEAAVDIESGPPFVVRGQSGRVLRARNVVLATGNRPRPFPLRAGSVPLPVVDAWDYPAVRAIAADARVCILGSGLSMVDAVLSLEAGGHRGAITVLSRHGLLPLPHAELGPHGDADEVDALLDLGVRCRMRALRQWVALRQREGEPWQWTIDRVRPHVARLWTSLSVVEQARFLRHALRLWDIHRHRVAPGVAATLDRLRKSGQLSIRAGRLEAFEGAGEDCRMRFRARASADVESVPVDMVVNGTGVELDIRRLGDPLLASLQRRGMVAVGRHGLGLRSDTAGGVLDAGGKVQPGLHVLGALRIGDIWESIAIPELRAQAQRIAHTVAGLSSD